MRLTERMPEFRKTENGSVDTTRRVVSAPNGLWLAQVKVTERGTRECDCWYTFPHAPTTKQVALMQTMHSMGGNDERK